MNEEELTRREILKAGMLSTLAGMAATADIVVAVDTPSAPGEPDWNQIAAQFLIEPGLAYLNTGSLGTSPPEVLKAADDAWRKLETNPVGLGYGSLLAEADGVRKLAAELLGCQPAELALTRNTTDGMNLVAQGMGLKPGDHVLTTNHEHGGGSRCWEYFARRNVIKIDRVELPLQQISAEQIVGKFEAAITPNTRVISLSHVTFSTGLQLPIAAISKLARERQLLVVVDGAQAVGAIPVDVKALGCHAYAASGHKWLLGSKGTGLLYIDAAVRDRIAPMLLDDGYGIYTAITGVPNIPGIIGLGAALNWTAKIGRRRIAARVLTLRNLVYRGLETIPRLTIVSPPPDSPWASPIVSFIIPSAVKAAAIAEALAKEHKIIVKTVDTLGIDIRISTHVCNTEEHVERLVGSLKRFAR